MWAGQRGYFHFAIGVGGHFAETGRYEFDHWHERSGRWPDDQERFLAEAIAKSSECDVYVAPYLRASPSRKKGNALPSRWLYADVDEQDPHLEDVLRQLIGPGGLLVDSGQGRHPYSRLPESLEPVELEQWNMRFARRLGADAGWAENKLLRLPGTFNHKPRALGGESAQVRLVDFEAAPRDLTLAELAELLPELPTMNGSAATVIVPELPATVPPRIQARLREQTGRDRSGQTFSFVKACIEEGLSDGQTLALALQHAPTLAKYGDRARGEVERAIQKLRTDAASAEKTSGPRRRFRLRPLAEVTPRAINWLVPGMIPMRTLTLVAGVGGLGKSTYLAAVAAQLSTGELGEPGDTIIVSFEDPAEEVLRPRIEAAGGDLTRVHEFACEGDGIDQLQLPTDLEELQDIVSSVPAKFVIFDPIVAAIDVALDAHKDQHVRKVLGGLAALAEEGTLAMALVGHLNKAPSADAYIRVASSVAFWNASRSVVLVTEDPDQPDDLRLVTQRKANWARIRPVERHRIETIVLPGTVDPDTGKPIETSRMVFVEVANDIDGSEVLHTKSPKSGNARAFLAQALADGDWHDSAGLKTLASGIGISQRTLVRAANDLQVETERRGFPSTTWWRLPAGATADTKSRQPLSHILGATRETAPYGLSQPVAQLATVTPPTDCGATDGTTNGLARQKKRPAHGETPDEIARVRAALDAADAERARAARSPGGRGDDAREGEDGPPGPVALSLFGEAVTLNPPGEVSGRSGGGSGRPERHPFLGDYDARRLVK